MVALSGIMRDSPDLLLDQFREPAVTAYNRLEARPRTHDFSRSLRAEVRDALWMLTRQWQLGEFEAKDAGSPVDARLTARRLQIDRVAACPNPPHAYDNSVPLEAMAERETVPFTHALRLQAAQYFLKLHPPALRTKYLPRYRHTFGFPQDRDDDFRGQVDGLNLYRATRRLGFDGEAALRAIENGSFDAAVPVDAVDTGAIAPLTAGLEAWFARQYTQPPVGEQRVWDSERLAYSVSAAAPAGRGASWCSWHRDTTVATSTGRRSNSTLTARRCRSATRRTTPRRRSRTRCRSCPYARRSKGCQTRGSGRSRSGRSTSGR